MPTIVETLSKELNKKEEYVLNVVTLLDEGNTVPFIARYRKEMHGTMDDQTIRVLADRLQYLRNLEERKGEVKNAIGGQGKLTEELSVAIDNAETLAAVEDLYRPYKQKRRTRATIARENGLEPLATLLFEQDPRRRSIPPWRPFRGRATSSPRTSPTTPPCAAECASCGLRGGRSSLRPPRRKIRSTATTINFLRP